MRENYLSTDRFKVKARAAHLSGSPELMLSPVPADGRPQPVPAGGVLLLHRRQSAAQVSSSAEGQKPCVKVVRRCAPQQR